MNFKQWEQAERLYTGTKPADRSVNRETVFYPGLTADCAFRCSGHSMEPTFFPGDLVFIRKQDSFIDGQIVAVQIGSGLTLKRLFRLSDGFRLIPDNKRFQPVDITGDEAETVKVFGIAVSRR